jgi:hypothetical protein
MLLFLLLFSYLSQVHHVLVSCTSLPELIQDLDVRSVTKEFVHKVNGYITKYVKLCHIFIGSCDHTYVHCPKEKHCSNRKHHSFTFSIFSYKDSNSWPTPWASPSALFCDGFFWDRIFQSICPDWLPTTILLNSVPGKLGLQEWASFIQLKYHFL